MFPKRLLWFFLKEFASEWPPKPDFRACGAKKCVSIDMEKRSKITFLHYGIRFPSKKFLPVSRRPIYRTLGVHKSSRPPNAASNSATTWVAAMRIKPVIQRSLSFLHIISIILPIILHIIKYHKYQSVSINQTGGSLRGGPFFMKDFTKGSGSAVLRIVPPVVAIYVWFSTPPPPHLQLAYGSLFATRKRKKTRQTDRCFRFWVNRAIGINVYAH